MCRQMLHIASVFIHLLVISILYNYIVWICCLSVGEPGVWREHVQDKFLAGAVLKR